MEGPGQRLVWRRQAGGQAGPQDPPKKKAPLRLTHELWRLSVKEHALLPQHDDVLQVAQVAQLAEDPGLEHAAVRGQPAVLGPAGRLAARAAAAAAAATEGPQPRRVLDLARILRGGEKRRAWWVIALAAAVLPCEHAP